jgi:hypothetical protein
MQKEPKTKRVKMGLGDLSDLEVRMIVKRYISSILGLSVIDCRPVLKEEYDETDFRAEYPPKTVFGGFKFTYVVEEVEDGV